MPAPSPSLERHSYYLDAIVWAQTLADLSSIRTEYTVDPVLTEGQKGVLRSRYEIREMQLKALYTAQPGVGAPAYALKDSVSAPESLSHQERVAVTHAQDDAVAFGTPDKEPVTAKVVDEVFPDVEIVTVDTTNHTPNDMTPTPPSQVTPPVSNPTPIPSTPVSDPIQQTAWPVWLPEPSEEAVPKKRTRTASKDRDDGNGTGWSKGVTAVTLSREIKLPIDGVQFSNNLFGITLTASTYEEAKAGIEEAFADFTNSTKLLSKDHVDKAYAQWLADWESKAKVEDIKNKLVIAPAVKAVYKDNLERSRAMILQLCAAFPEAKTFAQEFAKLNPIIQEQSIV